MPISNCLNLFTYGTLMDRNELAYRLVLPLAEVDRRLRLRVAELPGFRRIYNRADAEQGGAVLNLDYDKVSTVVGILVMDITNQELGMLDVSYPGHLPRKPVEVMVEGDKVPATVYLAKEVDPAAVAAPAYEKLVLDVAHRLGEPILSNFLEHTANADGTPRYQKAGTAAPGPSEEPPAEGEPAS